MLEVLIREYIIHLRHHRKLALASVSSSLAPIGHFFEMNDVIIRWNKLNKFKAKYRSIV